MRKFTLLLSFVLLVLIINAQQTGLFTTQVNWTNTVGSQSRSLVVYVPTNYNSGIDYSLVIGLHGLGDNPSNFIQGISYYTLNSYFGNVILACPDDGTPSTSWFSGDEDFDILTAIINHLDGTYSIDLNMVFAQGFSFGGKSAYLHGLEEADNIRGIIAHSPGFYNTADIHNNCNDPLHCQHDYNYQNASKVLVCITAGSGEYNLGLTEPYLDLAQKAVLKLNNSGGDAIFIEDPTGYHNLPPISIVQQCWDQVTKPLTNVEETKKLPGFNFYPNPASHKINFEIALNTNFSTAILDITGNVIHSGTFSTNRISISISDLANGIYLFKVYNKDGDTLYEKKFIVIK